VARLAWACRGRAAFGDNFQNKIRFSASVLRPNQTWLVVYLQF